MDENSYFTRGTPTKFLPKRSYQNVPAETFLKIKFLQKRFLAIKFLYPKVPKHKRLPGTNGSQIQMVPRYKWFPGTNGSQVNMVPRYKWFPGTNAMVPVS
jgi:hypothetical protein